MSMAVVHMEKYQQGAVYGIQSHVNREHPPKTNKDINSEMTPENYNLIEPPESYYKAIKARLDTLELKKKVRKDAVLMCSFVVSSDRSYFDGLSREQQKSFFSDAVEFFKNRYGAENVIAATVHMDEHTPHLHLSLVPIKDGKLSAKTLFNRQELTNLQTDFVASIGAKHGLERGQSESKAAHLSEIDYKLKMRSRELEQTNDAADRMQDRINALREEAIETEKVVSVSQETLDRHVKELEKVRAEVKELRESKEYLSGMAEKFTEAAKEQGGKLLKVQEKIFEVPKVVSMPLIQSTEPCLLLKRKTYDEHVQNVESALASAAIANQERDKMAKELKVERARRITAEKDRDEYRKFREMYTTLLPKDKQNELESRHKEMSEKLESAKSMPAWNFMMSYTAVAKFLGDVGFNSNYVSKFEYLYDEKQFAVPFIFPGCKNHFDGDAHHRGKIVYLSGNPNDGISIRLATDEEINRVRRRKESEQALQQERERQQKSRGFEIGD